MMVPYDMLPIVESGVIQLDVAPCVFMYIGIYIYTYIYTYSNIIYIYIHTYTCIFFQFVCWKCPCFLMFPLGVIQ